MIVTRWSPAVISIVMTRTLLTPFTSFFPLFFPFMKFMVVDRQWRGRVESSV